MNLHDKFEAKESSDSDDESNSESDKVEDKAVEFESYKKHIEYFRSLNISDKWNLLIVPDDENDDERHEEVEEPENDDDSENNDQSIEIEFTRDEFRRFIKLLHEFEYSEKDHRFLCFGAFCGVEGYLLKFDENDNKLLKLLSLDKAKESKDE